MSDESLDALIVRHRHPISVAMYHQMIDRGVISGNDRVELVEGVIIAMSPRSRAHIDAIEELLRILMAALGREWAVRTQAPLTLARSEPEPDLYVVRRAIVETASRHPNTASLVIEVAKSSLALDRAMAAIYAEAGVPEYWIVDVDHSSVEVFRDPRGTVYRSHQVVDVDATLTPLELPNVTVEVGAPFRTRH